MFTGLIQSLGTLHQRTRSGDSWSLAISAPLWPEPLQLGESIAVQGICLTVTRILDNGFTVDLLDETLARTALAKLPPGAPLNLERALRLSDRLGGHIVSGHIDECGRISLLQKHGRNHVLRIACSPDLCACTIPKGSVAIDGISLTVAALGDDWLEVHIIPHTWQATSLCHRKSGDPVNLEADLFGKYARKFLGAANPAPLSEETLRRAGF